MENDGGLEVVLEVVPMIGAIVATPLYANAPVLVVWDMENSTVRSPRAFAVPAQMRSFLVHHGYNAADVEIHAIRGSAGTLHHLVVERIQMQHENGALTYTQSPLTTKNAADGVMKKKIELFVEGHPAPATVVIVASDSDYEGTVVNLRDAGYNPIVVYDLAQTRPSYLTFLQTEEILHCTKDAFFSN